MWEIVSFKPEAYADACRICNELNDAAVWLRYTVDKKKGDPDGEIVIPAGGKDTGERHRQRSRQSERKIQLIPRKVCGEHPFICEIEGAASMPHFFS